MKMALLLERNSEITDPESAKKQASMAEVFRRLAHKAAKEEPFAANEPRIMMNDPPAPVEAIEVWERFLAEVMAMPETAQKPQTILYAEHMIALKKGELIPMPSNLPSMVAMVDEPGLFGDNLSEWRQFLAEVEQLPDSVQKRQTVNNAKQVIAMKMWEYDLPH
ncbi:hypothetical protein JQ609_24175 [Bradyrhizobium sp. AUGA SZCCT0169]|uniref:hypothetical protein n=1 Tax=Bradyrhizobium sp. AUGA SZCCT0169 TaxID=2807663 RepID=UPI001BA69FE3|nr:hypothetical protein [Bradyrhizobium sp. AUGA SZCCT0169]MBR1250009.1 hypothetical protein [Bradyrhizobium sp. AUGA SZCCT0169]